MKQDNTFWMLNMQTYIMPMQNSLRKGSRKINKNRFFIFVHNTMPYHKAVIAILYFTSSYRYIRCPDAFVVVVAPMDATFISNYVGDLFFL